MQRFGENLKETRESKGITLQEVARSTRISVRFLEAIENEQFHILPGGLFNVSFVRQYARSIGVNEEQAAAEFEKLAPPVELDLEQHFRADADESAPQLAAARIAEGTTDFLRRNSTALLRTFAAFILLATSGFLYFVYENETVSGPAVAVEADAEPTQTESAEVTPVQSKSEEPERSKPLNVELQVVEKVWVRAAADGQRVLERTLRAGERRSIDAHSSVRLLVGNAGGLEIALNGKPMPSIGPRGHVRRVVLTESGMKILEPGQPSAPSDDETTTSASAQTPQAAEDPTSPWVRAELDSR